MKILIIIFLIMPKTDFPGGYSYQISKKTQQKLPKI